MTGIPTQTTLSGILLVTIGTLGDVLPFLVIGRHLQANGLVVKVATHEHYRAQVEAHGLAFRPLTVEGDLRQFVTHTHAWNPERGVAAAVDKLILPNVVPVFELIENEAVGRDMLVLAHAHALGARVAQDRYDLRLWTLYPSAWLFQSVFAGQVYPRVKMTLVGDRGRQRLRYHVVDWTLNKVCGKAEAAPRYVIAKRSAMWYRRLARRLFAGISDAMLAKPVNALRRRVGLPPVRGVLTSWCHSSQRTVGLFSSWYAEPQPDWPARCLLTGFIRGGSNVTLSEDLQAFLNKGSAPVVFTFGSEKTANREAFVAAMAACRRLQKRAVFISPDPADIPSGLPATIFFTPFAPFDDLFAHACCVVHHGGMGTAVAAIDAGVPQVLVPFSYDQPDNATRLLRLGVGEILPPAHCDATHLATVIDLLTTSSTVGDHCRRCAQLARKDRALDTLAEEILRPDVVRS